MIARKNLNEKEWVQIMCGIEGTIMTEIKENGVNAIAFNRILVYVDEFVYDESKESFI